LRSDNVGGYMNMRKLLLATLGLVMLLSVATPIAALPISDPKIELTKTEMVFYVKQGEQQSDTLGIYNRGAGTLMFTLSKTYEKVPETNSLYSPNGNLMVDPPYIDFGTVPGKGKMSRTLTCTAPGEQYLQVTATPDKSWITCQVLNVKVDVVTVTITIDLDGFVAGQLYRGNVIVSSNAGMATVPILLQVATSQAYDWLKYEPDNGMIDGGKSTASVVIVDAAGMKPGEYKATIIVTSNDKEQPIIQVPVKMVVLSGAAPPGTPPTFSAYPGNNKVHLFWDTVNMSQGGLPIVGYNIYRATYPNGYDNVAITDFFVSGMQYTDPNVENGITYYYIIKAVDSSGVESDPSKEVTVTPKLIEPVINLTDGATTRQQYFEVTGTAESNSSVVVNGQPTKTNPDGSFSTFVILQNGENTVNIVVVDPISDPISQPNPDNTYSFSYKINFATITSVVMMVGSKDATINGVYKQNVMPVAPTIIGSRSMVPFRFLGEALGAEIGWDADARKVTYSLEGRTIELWIGKQTAKVNGQAVIVDPPPQIVGGSTVVPVRFISEGLGASVEWYAATKSIAVKYPAQ